MNAGCKVSLISAFFLIFGSNISYSQNLPGFSVSGRFHEQVREIHDPSGLVGTRIVINAPANDKFDSSKPTELIFYSTPNGNTIEQTLGAHTKPGQDFHFDIQHIAAQVRRLREMDASKNYVLAVVQADNKSWPTWRQTHQDNASSIRKLVAETSHSIPGNPVRVSLTGHSGGGSFLFGFINGGEAIPTDVDRIAFLDANYSFAVEDKHDVKLLKWLKENESHRLMVIAYDDRNITLDGKPVVSSTGGTYRASHRMIDAFRRTEKFSQSVNGLFEDVEGFGGRCLFYIHQNPENKILHTALVGEMNGFLEAMSFGTSYEGKWGTWGGPRAYTKWIDGVANGTSTTPSVPQVTTIFAAHPVNAEPGSKFMARISTLPPADRELEIVKAITVGNVPVFQNDFVRIFVSATDSKGIKHYASYEVLPDYLSIGGDSDWVRVPMNPLTAQAIADKFHCILPTARMADDIYQQAEIKLAPRPLTHDREKVQTFVEHHQIIELQKTELAAQRQITLPVGAMVAGNKKDIILTNRLLEKPNRVAIYGWHLLTGIPIQPVTIVHRDTYVDYSHGVRLVKDQMIVDGKTMAIKDVLVDPILSVLISDEGPLKLTAYGHIQH